MTLIADTLRESEEHWPLRPCSSGSASPVHVGCKFSLVKAERVNGSVTLPVGATNLKSVLASRGIRPCDHVGSMSGLAESGRSGRHRWKCQKCQQPGFGRRLREATNAYKLLESLCVGKLWSICPHTIQSLGEAV